MPQPPAAVPPAVRLAVRPAVGHRPVGAVAPVPEPPLRVLVGAVLRRHRERQGRTLRDVAEAARVSVPYLSEVERGRKEASSEVLGAVCRALGLALVDLVGDAHADLARAAGRVVVDLTAAPGPAARRPLPAPAPTALLLAA